MEFELSNKSDTTSHVFQKQTKANLVHWKREGSIYLCACLPSRFQTIRTEYVYILMHGIFLRFSISNTTVSECKRHSFSLSFARRWNKFCFQKKSKYLKIETLTSQVVVFSNNLDKVHCLWRIPKESQTFWGGQKRESVFEGMHIWRFTFLQF